jgi:undecaprenyl-diphosphatase
VVVGTLPVVALVLLLGPELEALRTPTVVAWALAGGALAMMLSERLGTHSRDEDTIGYGEALLIGVAQAAALVPGISRSGATLTLALLFGLRRAGAARFVFLMSLPAVLAAAAKEILDVVEAGASDLPVTLFGVGLVVSGVVGYLTIKYFLRYLANHSLTVFALYRFALAGATAVWLTTR